MKKFLLTAALILALVTSLTAGTMAYYSAEVDTISSTITSKSFNFTAEETSNSFTTGIKIAPGDKVQYLITVNNSSEVRTDATVTAALSVSFTGLTVDVAHTGTSIAANSSKVDGAAGSESTATTLMGTSSSQQYLVTVAWDYDTGVTTNDTINHTTELTINVSGKQHNEGAVINASAQS